MAIGLLISIAAIVRRFARFKTVCGPLSVVRCTLYHVAPFPSPVPNHPPFADGGADAGRSIDADILVAGLGTAVAVGPWVLRFSDSDAVVSTSPEHKFEFAVCCGTP